MYHKVMQKIAASGPVRRLRALKRDKKGVAAIEFAMVLPIMLMLYLGSMELHHTLSADRRVTDLAGAAGDLTAQSSQITGAQMTNIFNAASTFLKPYSTESGSCGGTDSCIENLRVTVTSICHTTDDAGNHVGRVDWSANYQNGGVHDYSHGDVIDLPLDEHGEPVLTIPGTSLILAEVEYDLTTPASALFARNVLGDTGASTYVHNLGDHYYLRPRLTETPSVLNEDAGGNANGCADGFDD